MQTFKLSFLADNVALCNGAFVMQPYQLNSSIIVVPRAQLDAVAANSMVMSQPSNGVYVLVSNQRMFVGGTNHGLVGIKQHELSKNFWQVAVLFVSSAFDEQLVSLLKEEVIAYLQHSGTFELDNEQLSEHQHMNLGAQDDVQLFLQLFHDVLDFLGSNPMAVAQMEVMGALTADTQSVELRQQQALPNEAAEYVKSKDQEVRDLKQQVVKLQQQLLLDQHRQKEVAIAQWKQQQLQPLQKELTQAKQHCEQLQQQLQQMQQGLPLVQECQRLHKDLENMRKENDQLRLEKAQIQQENQQLNRSLQQQQLQPPVSEPKYRPEQVFSLQGKARMVRISEGHFVLLRGAQINADSEHPRLPNYVHWMYKLLPKLGILTKGESEYYLKHDLNFEKAAAAGSFVLGRNCGGNEWRDAQGRSLHDLDMIATYNQGSPAATSASSEEAVLSALDPWRDEPYTDDKTVTSNSASSSNAGGMEQQVELSDADFQTATGQPSDIPPSSDEMPEQLRGVFHLHYGQLQAHMEYRGPKQWVLLRGSQVRGYNRSDCGRPDTAKMLAEAKAKSELIALPDGHFQTCVDLGFSSPSTAAKFVVGTSANGFKLWRNDAGVKLKTLKDLVDKFEGKAAQHEQDALSQ